ncbi:MAG: mechanosensitive ion channel, partial [Psychrilyobacter sp.]|nr:mechanosensitive ion channel [Psychrilyobacter sp.]
VLDVINDIYETYPVSRQKPIKSYLQVLSIIGSIIALILIIALLMDKSPVKVLSGVGALTAVIMFIFKDAILGFIASIQLAANNMVAIGDWIEMSSHGADGDVIEINLTNVKVQNFDKTITTIPSYALISSSFRNWKGMQQAGNRRIKRPIFIDSNSVKFLTPEEVNKFKEIEVLGSYISEKEEEIKEYNEKHKVEKSYINGRRLTNIGLLRAYIKLFLLEHPMINNNLTLLVRQQEPTPQGIPIEIYCFAKTTVWQEYEGIQSDIFEHLIPLINEFGLTVFQNPTGNDFRNLNN